jgi:uncharacterized protein (TIGR02266 family)
MSYDVPITPVPPKPVDVGEASKERRSTPRVAIEVTVSLTSESHFFVGLTGDLSQGGLFVATYRELSIGTEMEVALTLPDGLLAARGQVRWVRRATDTVAPGVGVAFEQLTEADRARIETFCAARAPWYYEVGG